MLLPRPLGRVAWIEPKLDRHSDLHTALDFESGSGTTGTEDV